jgi:hypothetical protein
MGYRFLIYFFKQTARVDGFIQGSPSDKAQMDEKAGFGEPG